MKGSVVALAALVSFVSAQNFGAEPSCAIPCLTSAILVAGCALTDEACQCGTGQAAIQTAVTPCLLTACDGADLGVAASVGLGLCSSYSAAIAAANATTTASTVVSTSSAIIATTTVMASMTSAPASSSSPATSSAPATSSVPATTSAPVSTSAKTNTTMTTSSAAPVSTGGAPAMVIGLGSVVGIVAGLMAVL